MYKTWAIMMGAMMKGIKTMDNAAFDYDPKLEKKESPDGMTLRDWFASHEWTEPPDITVREAAEFLGIPEDQYDYKIHWPIFLARWRYKMADAMIKARETGNG